MNLTTIIVTPLSGAVIGYFTNWLAIKMLFRPRTEKRLFGVKLPFTPGLIPKERYALSKKVGETLSEKVLTEEELAKALTSPEVSAKVSELIDEFFNNLKDGRYSAQIERISELAASKANGILSAPELVTEGFAASAKRFITEKAPDVSAAVSEFINNLPEKYPDVNDKLKQMVVKLARDNFGSFLGIFINYDNIFDKIRNGLAEYLAEPSSQTFISEKLIEYFEAYVEGDGLYRLVSGVLPDLEGAAKSFSLKAINGVIDSMDESRLDSLRGFLMNAFSVAAAKGGAYIARSLEIGKIIENKINAFSVEETEEIIVSVVERELKTITRLGGVLGLVIGFVPVIIQSLGL